jgi:hypothetical protein
LQFPDVARPRIRFQQVEGTLSYSADFPPGSLRIPIDEVTDQERNVSIKHLCAESDEGREIEHNPDSWLESEIARFHRGISLALLFLAGLPLVVEMLRHQRPMELLILSGFLVPIALLGSQLSLAFLAPRR